MEEDSLVRIAGFDLWPLLVSWLLNTLNILGSLSMTRAELKVIFKNPDRPNIYQQMRIVRETVDVG